MDESERSRRVINFGPRGLVHDGSGVDLNKRYDQSFDSQSKDLSVINSSRQDAMQFGSN